VFGARIAFYFITTYLSQLNSVVHTALNNTGLSAYLKQHFR